MFGFVHGHGLIGGLSLKKWLPEQHPAVRAVEFQPVYPGHGQLVPRYRKHPDIKTFLRKTTLVPSIHGKLLRVDYHGSSAEPERPGHELAITWLLHIRVRLTGDRNFQNVLNDRKVRQETSLKAASFIAYACSDISGQASEHPDTIKVELNCREPID